MPRARRPRNVLAKDAPPPSIPGEKRVKDTDATVPVGRRKRTAEPDIADRPETLDGRRQFRGTDDHLPAGRTLANGGGKDGGGGDKAGTGRGRKGG